VKGGQRPLGSEASRAQREPGAGFWSRLFGDGRGTPPAVILDPGPCFSESSTGPAGKALALTAAFLIRLAGGGHRLSAPAGAFLRHCLGDHNLGRAARLFLDALEFVPGDVARAAAGDPSFAEVLGRLDATLGSGSRPDLQERLWAVFFPEGVGIREHESERISELRRRRFVRLDDVNPAPLNDPLRQMLFTANVLLAPPPARSDLDALPLPPGIRKELPRIMTEPQVNWYDHPVRLGTPTGKNEVLYGLRHLDEALGWEVRKGNAPSGARAVCVLSVSVTHEGLNRVARAYLEHELALGGGLKHLDIYAFTEADVRALLEQILLPLVGQAGGALAGVFGVDGPYGRHYSFLKAIAALWQVFVDPGLRAVFKIDLDQVFPQAELEREAGGSMADLFRTPLWGARGRDSDGEPVDLDMIAGTLVNEGDIGCGLFTPDVTCRELEPGPAERLFWSRLPQALSTEAEMTARYDQPPLDGRTGCLQRVHVTGGTTGILIEALRRHRPFTPSFIGRAEDQAYLMSTFGRRGPKLGYLHCPGLVMRHDKASFAGDAVRAARPAKAVGDIVRVLEFSAYARALGDREALKRRFDPFTGCFISKIPRTIALLRFALEAVTEFSGDGPAAGREFVTAGALRLRDTLRFTDPDSGEVERRLNHEREGWEVFFDALSRAETRKSGPLRAAVAEVVRNCRIPA
jgi:hypothetical protein